MTIDQVDQAACHELAKVVSYGISTDNTQAMLVFEDADRKRATVHMSVDRVKRLQSIFHEMAQALEKRGIDPGNVLIKRPTREPLVGHSDQFRGHVILGLEVGTQDEDVYALPDQMALQTAKHIEHEVISRTSPQQRAMMTAGMRRIIMPPGH